MESKGSKTLFVTVGDEHWYPSYKLKDTWYPSVTTILQCYPKGEGFHRYLANLSSWDESREILGAAGKRGTKVHEGTERLEKGETLNREEYSLEEWQMLEGFVKWHKKYKPLVIAIEASVVSDKIKTGGTIDRVYVIDGKYTLLDVKTSSAIHESYWCQTACYDALWREKEGNVIDQTAILRLATKRKEGYEYVTHDRKEIDDDFNTFEAVQTIWKRENPKAKPKVIEVPVSLSLIK